MKVTLKGKGKWISKTMKEWDKPDGTKDRSWSILFYPDEQSLEEIRDLQMRGLKNRLRKDDDGICLSLSRKYEKLIKGKVVTFDPPFIKDVEGKDIEQDVGNGSEIIVELDVYEHSVPGSKNKSVAARYEGVTVTKLNEYTGTPSTKQDTVEALF